MADGKILVFPSTIYYNEGFFLKFTAYDYDVSLDKINRFIGKAEDARRAEAENKDKDKEKDKDKDKEKDNKDKEEDVQEISSLATTQIKKFVCFLPINNAIDENLQLKWKSVENVLSGNWQSEYARMQLDTLQQLVSGILGNAGSAGGKFLKQGISSENLSVSTKRYIYPNFGYMFEGVGFRKFNFNYTLIPMNAKESQDIIDIINGFKYYSLPGEENKLSGIKTVLKYPSIWNIELLRRSEIGTSDTSKTKSSKIYGLISFKDLVLTDIKITYGKSGEGEIYFYQDGMPNEIKISLSFTEMKFLTRETSGITPIENGGNELRNINQSVGNMQST